LQRGSGKTTGVNLIRGNARCITWRTTDAARPRGKDTYWRAFNKSKKGIYVNESGDRLKGIMIFNVPVGDNRYVEAILR